MGRGSVAQLTAEEVPSTTGSIVDANGPSGLSMSHTCSISGVGLLVLPRGHDPLLSLLSKSPPWCTNATAIPAASAKPTLEGWCDCVSGPPIGGPAIARL